MPKSNKLCFVLCSAVGLIMALVASSFATQDVRVVGTVAVKPVSGTTTTVSVINFPATQPVSGPLTNTELRATPPGVLIYGSTSPTGQPILVPLDSATNTLQTIDYEHHEAHSGSAFNIIDTVDLALNSVVDLQIITPNTTKWSHLLFVVASESELDWYVYENVVIVTSGTPVIPINNNRNSSNTSTLLVYLITNTSLVNANADTTVSSALEIAHGLQGSGRTFGTTTRDHELILKQNTKYTFRGIANTAGHVTWDVSWYEHTNKN